MFDDLFTSTNLLRTLKETSPDRTGTHGQNRIPNDPLTSVSVMKKKPRGISVSAETTDGSIKMTRWKDNQVVTVMSTVYGIASKDQASRWSHEQKKIVVLRPAAIREYNRHMGGTDLSKPGCEQTQGGHQLEEVLLANFSWFLDVAVANSG